MIPSIHIKKLGYKMKSGKNEGTYTIDISVLRGNKRITNESKFKKYENNFDLLRDDISAEA